MCSFVCFYITSSKNFHPSTNGCIRKDTNMISRHELGSLLLNWHGSQYDPTYAVGSFYIDNNVYPNKDVVEECIASLELDVSKYRRMQKVERVFAYTAQGSTDDLKTWAGYS